MEKKIEKTSNGNLFTRFTGSELKRMGMGACLEDGGEHIVVCGMCNEVIEDDEECFYVACLNDVVCEKCFKEEVEAMSHYNEDEQYEQHHMAIMLNTYNMVEASGADLTGKRNIFISTF